MKQIYNYIQEKLRLGKDTKVEKTDGIIDEPLEMTNEQVKFPLILEIDHIYKENIIGYIIKDSYIRHYHFYNDKNHLICTMNDLELKKIFDEEKGVMLNTCYGWKGTIWRR